MEGIYRITIVFFKMATELSFSRTLKSQEIFHHHVTRKRLKLLVLERHVLTYDLATVYDLLLEEKVLSIMNQNGTIMALCVMYLDLSDSCRRCQANNGITFTKFGYFVLRERRTSKTRARVKITPRERRDAVGREKNDHSTSRLFRVG